MKIAAICSDFDICTGLKLTGIECHHVTTEAEITTVLAALQTADIGVLVVSENLAESASLTKFSNANPQVLVHRQKFS